MFLLFFLLILFVYFYNQEGITAVDVALANNQMEMVKIFVLAGANITANFAKGPLGNLQAVKKSIDLSNQSLYP